jgi:large repetitive protein
MEACMKSRQKLNQFEKIETPSQLKLNVGEEQKLEASVKPADASYQTVLWSVYQQSSEDVVTITVDGKMKANKPGTAIVQVRSQEGANKFTNCTVTVESGIHKVSINKNNLLMYKGNQETLTATVDASPTKSKSVVWSVYEESAKDVITVSQTGLITALNTGKATIRATSEVDKTKFADCIVNIESGIKNVSLNKNSLNLNMGEKEQLSAVVDAIDKKSKSVVWSVYEESSMNVISLSDSGLVSALNQGNATIRVTSVEDPLKYAECKITVLKVEPSPITSSNTSNSSSNSGKSSTPSVTTIPNKTEKYEVVLENGKKIFKVQTEFSDDKKVGIANIGEDVLKDNKNEPIVLQLKSDEKVKKYELNLSPKLFDENFNQMKIEIKTEIGNIQLSPKMFQGTEYGIKGTVSFELEEMSTFNQNAMDLKGVKSIINLNIKIDGKIVQWKNEKYPVKVSIPFIPNETEKNRTQFLVVYYLNDNGQYVSTLKNGKYDASGMMIFETPHFSQFAIAFVEKTFKDLENHVWAKDFIESLAARKVIYGRSENEFSPSEMITRADFIVMLVKALDLNTSFEDNFKDVSKNDYYYESLGIAKKLNIASGTGNGMYDPKSPISRQDMFTLTVNALTRVKDLNLAYENADLERFKDKNEISPYANSSIGGLTSNGIIVGDQIGIRPKSNASRAETAVFIYKVLEFLFK